MIDGEIIRKDFIEVGEPIVFGGEIPTKEGYTFSGWNYIPDTMPAENVIVYGIFTLTDGIASSRYCLRRRYCCHLHT